MGTRQGSMQPAQYRLHWGAGYIQPHDAIHDREVFNPSASDPRSVGIKPDRGMAKAKLGEYPVIQLSGSAPKNERVSVIGRLQRDLHARFHMCGNSNLNQAQNPIGVIRGVVACEPVDALLPNWRNHILAGITHHKRGDKVAAIHPCVKDQQSDAVLRGQQCADNIHFTSDAVITESETGLGIPGEIRQPSNDDGIKADLSLFDDREIIIDLDGDDEGQP